MIRRFRKIRQILLSKNKVSKYLLYALGEIILVVLGILLALQINTWNENHQRSKEEIKLLTALLEDFNENRSRIQNAISKEEKVVSKSRVLIQAMQSKRTDIVPDSIRDWVASGARSWWKTEFITGTYDAMVSSGKIEVLKNDDLKSILSQFSADINSGFEDHYESMNYLIEMNKISADITPALIHDSQRQALGVEIMQEEFDTDVLRLVNNDSYLGLLISKTWLETLRINYQKKLQSYVEEIISICQSELAK